MPSSVEIFPKSVSVTYYERRPMFEYWAWKKSLGEEKIFHHLVKGVESPIKIEVKYRLRAKKRVKYKMGTEKRTVMSGRLKQGDVGRVFQSRGFSITNFQYFVLGLYNLSVLLKQGAQLRLLLFLYEWADTNFFRSSGSQLFFNHLTTNHLQYFL